MSLLYVDKNSSSRLSPKVNAGDVHQNRKAHATDSIAPRAEGTQTSARITTKNDQIIVYDDANERIVIGRLPDGTYGIAISKSGYDVSDAFS